MTTPDDDLRTQANELYWESDASVADIAGRLGLSRRALYEALEPAPAGEACPDCGAPMLYANRLARSSHQPQCPICHTGIGIAAMREASADAGSEMRRAASAPSSPAPGAEAGDEFTEPFSDMLPDTLEQEMDASRLSPVATVEALESARMVRFFGAFLAGVGAGVITALLVHRR